MAASQSLGFDVLLGFRRVLPPSVLVSVEIPTAGLPYVRI
jgi:hypothetical protein